MFPVQEHPHLQLPCFTEHKAHQTMRYSKITEGKFAETNILVTIEAHSDHKMRENFILHFPRVKSMSYGL